MIAGMKECVELYAKERGISKSQADTEFKTALDVIADMCVNGGVSFKGLFTIKKKLRKGRSGNINGKTWETKDTNVLVIKTGSKLAENLNK